VYLLNYIGVVFLFLSISRVRTCGRFFCVYQQYIHTFTNHTFMTSFSDDEEGGGSDWTDQEEEVPSIHSSRRCSGQRTIIVWMLVVCCSLFVTGWVFQERIATVQNVGGLRVRSQFNFPDKNDPNYMYDVIHRDINEYGHDDYDSSDGVDDFDGIDDGSNGNGEDDYDGSNGNGEDDYDSSAGDGDDYDSSNGGHMNGLDTTQMVDMCRRVISCTATYHTIDAYTPSGSLYLAVDGTTCQLHGIDDHTGEPFPVSRYSLYHRHVSRTTEQCLNACGCRTSLQASCAMSCTSSP